MSTQARKPAGAPSSSGGQFDGRGVRGPSGILNNDEVEDFSIINKKALTLARNFARRSGSNPEAVEDIAQDALVEMLELREAGKLRNGDSLNANSALLTSLIQKSAAKYRLDEGTFPDRSARKLLSLAKEVRERELGRELTVSEYEKEAASIWAAFPPRRRPSKDFHHHVELLSIDSHIFTGSDHQPKLGDRIIIASVEHKFNYDNTALGDHVEAVEALKPAERRMMQRSVWSTLNEHDSNVPIPDEAKFTTRQRADLAKTAEAHGGVYELARAWSNGLTTEDQEKVLFAPFGTLTFEQREAVIDKLTASRERGPKMWEAAMSFATKPKK